jgi:hypothetical protein
MVVQLQVAQQSVIVQSHFMHGAVATFNHDAGGQTPSY